MALIVRGIPNKFGIVPVNSDMYQYSMYLYMFKILEVYRRRELNNLIDSEAYGENKNHQRLKYMIPFLPPTT